MRFRGLRALLNPPGEQSTAAIVAEIEDTRTWLPDRFRHGKPLHWNADQYGDDADTDWSLQPEYTLKLSDCDRAVNFVIGWDDAAKRRASLAKVDTMIGALTEFRDALAEEQRLYIIRRRAARLAGPKSTDAATAINTEKV